MASLNIRNIEELLGNSANYVGLGLHWPNIDCPVAMARDLGT